MPLLASEGATKNLDIRAGHEMTIRHSVATTKIRPPRTLLNRIQSRDHERHGSSLSEPGRGGGDLESRGNAIFRDGMLLQIKRFVWWRVRLATAAPRKHGLLTCRSNGRSGISSKSNNRSSLCVQPNPRGPRSIGLHLTKSPARSSSGIFFGLMAAGLAPDHVFLACRRRILRRV
jgi:hypothetical protein